MESLALDHPTVLRASAARHDGALRWLVAFLLTGIFCALQINQSLMMGSLALPPTYDAVSYYVNAATLLRIFHVSGFSEVLSAFFRSPPHSPLSTGLALVGFSIFGIKNWVGSVANACVAFFFVRAFLETAKRLPIGQGTMLAIALLGFPLAGLSIIDFRPDIICGLLIASGTLFILLRESWIYSRTEQLIAGILFGSALWTKPTVFPFTVVLFSLAIMLANFGSPRGEAKNVLKAGLVTSGIAVLISLPYYALKLPEVITYIWNTAFGSQASIWVKQIPIKENVLFYLTEHYGRISLGDWLYMGFLLGAAIILVAWWKNDRHLLIRVIRVATLVVLAYGLVTVPEFKGPHGFPFAAIFLGATALACVGLAGFGRTFGWALCTTLVFFSIWQFTWPFQSSYQTIVSPEYARSRWDMLYQTLRAIGHDAAGKTVFQTTPQSYLNETVLAFEYYARGLIPPIIEQAQVDDKELQERIATIDIVLALTPDSGEVFAHLATASSDFRAQIIQLTEASGQFALPIRVPDPGGGALLIYKRASAVR